MAGGEPVDLDGYKLVARPLSRWRRFTRDFWPYWQAQEPSFLLKVTRTGAPAQSVTITWFIRFANNQVSPGQVVVPSLQTSESEVFKVGGKFLGYTGDTLLVVPTSLSSTDQEPYRTIYAFHTTPKVWVFLATVAGLLAGLFASLLQYLFRL